MALKSVEKKKKRVSDQLSVLIQYMDEHRLFAAGKFQDPHNGIRLNELEWSELVSTLNEMGPAKTVDQWKKNGIVINEFEMYIDNTKGLEDLQEMVELSNSDPVEGGCSSIAEQMVGVHASEKLVPSTSKTLSKTDMYKNLVDESNGALKVKVPI